MTYTYTDILGNERYFRRFNEGYDKLMEATSCFGSPKGYSRGIDFIYDMIDSCCKNMTRSEIVDLCEAIDHVQHIRMHYHWDNKIPYPKDYDEYKENYNGVVEHLKLNETNSQQNCETPQQNCG